MTAPGLSQKDIYLYAEKILAGILDWKQLEHLSDDDLARVKTVTDRGPAALSEQPVETRVDKRKLRAMQQQRGRGSDSTYVPLEDVKPDLLSLAAHIPFEPFPAKWLFAPTEIELNTVMEALTRRLSARDLALYLGTLKEGEREQLLAAVSPMKAKDIEVQLEQLSEAPKEQVDVALSGASLVLLELFRKTKISPGLEQMIGSYSQELESSILRYCQVLPERLGITGVLSKFTDQNWMRLAGLTPREDMARLGMILDRPYFEKLKKPLPERQSKELQEFMKQQVQDRERDPERIGDIITTLRSWTATVTKVERMDKM